MASDTCASCGVRPVSAIGTSLAPFSIAGQRSGGTFITGTGADVFLLLSGAMVQAVDFPCAC
jgi:hypothetical protein